MTMSNSPSTSASGVVLAHTAPPTPLRSALATVTGTAAGLMSIASARDAPRTQATMPSTPEPQPTSSTVAPGNSAVRIERNVSTVVGWSPSPKVAPGSMATATAPGATSIGTQAGWTTRSRSIHVATAWRRQVSATDSSIVTRRHRHRAGKAVAAWVIASTSSPSEVHSSTS